MPENRLPLSLSQGRGDPNGGSYRIKGSWNVLSLATCGQLLTLEGPVELHPLDSLQLEDPVLVPGVAGPGILVEDVVTREGVFRPREVELRHQPQPDGHGVLPVARLVTGVKI